MTATAVAALLERHRTVGLDTSVFIFKVEANARYLELVNPVFDWLEGPKGHAVTSTVTMLELLVLPYRASDIDLVNRFYALLSTYPNLHWIAPTLEIADRAAQLRADYNLRTPDALQAATALFAQSTAMITNDPGFKRIEALEVLVLEDLLQA